MKLLSGVLLGQFAARVDAAGCRYFGMDEKFQRKNVKIIKIIKSYSYK